MRTLRALVCCLAVFVAVSFKPAATDIDANGARGVASQAARCLLAQADARVPVLERAMVDNNWFRGERGCATATLPELGSEWTVSQTEIGVNLYLGKPNSWRSQVLIMAWPAERAGEEKAEGLALATKVMETYTASFTRTNPVMTPCKPACEIYSPGGKAMYQVFKGAASGQKPMTAYFRVIADGRCALLVRAWCLDDDNWTTQSKVTDKLWDTIRVGGFVPRLPARDPGTAIEGVYQGPTRYSYNNRLDVPWMIFDKRGYVLERDPSCRAVNVEAYYQYSPNLVGRYTVKDGVMDIVWPLGEREDKRSFEVVDKGLKVDGELYERMDKGRLSGKRLHGEWSHSEFTSTSYGSVTSSTYSSSHYRFFDSGKFRRGSSFDSNYSDSYNPSSGTYNPADPGFRSWAASHASEYGIYRIEGDIIILDYADGTTTRMPVYAESDKNEDLLYFYGTGYLKEKGGPGEPPPDMPGPAAQARPPVPFVPEIWRDGFLRARGGASILRLPKLDDYTMACHCAPEITQVTVFKGKEIDKTPAITMVFALPAETFRDDTRDDKAIGKDTAKKMADNFLKDRAHLKLEGDPKEVALPGGAAYSLVYAGARDGGAREVLSVITVADDKCVVMFLSLGVGAEYAGIVKSVVNVGLNNLRVGSKVPKLDDQKPGVAINGVYCSEPDANGNANWLVFDPRGFINNRVPTCECDLDLHALMLYDSAAVGRYEVKDGEIETAYAPPRVGGKAKFKNEPGKLTIGDVVYYRLDGGQRPRVGLTGKYVSGGEVVFFTADGRFSFESEAAAGAAKNAEVRRAECVETAAAPAKASKSGCYRVENDRLLLWLEDGRKLSRTLFGLPGKSGALLIDGKVYSPAK